MLELFMKNGKFRNYLLYQTFRGMGSGMFGLFIMWAVHELYGNQMYTGIAVFLFGIPGVASFIVGPFIDRHNRVAIIRIACFAKFMVIGLMFVALHFFTLSVLVIFAAILAIGIINMFNAASAAYLPSIVDVQELIAANAGINIFGMVAGLAMGGILFFVLGGSGDISAIFAIAAMFLFIAFGFTLQMRNGNEEKHKVAEKPNYLAEMKTGFFYLRKGALAHFVIALVVMSVFEDIQSVNWPLFSDLYAGGAQGYIVLMFVAMTGSIMGSFIIKQVGEKFSLSKIIIAGLFASGLVMVAFINIIPGDFSRGLLVYALYIGIGSAVGISIQSFRQKFLPESVLGRVGTMTTTMYCIAGAVGALLGGVVGTLLDVRTIMYIYAVSYIIIGLGLCLSKKVRQLPKLSDVVQLNDMQ